MEVWQEILISAFSGGGIAWVFMRLFVKDISRDVATEEIETKLKNYTTKEVMQIERKELLGEVKRDFLSIITFREFEKRIDDRFTDNSKRFDKIDCSLDHITELLIKKG